jgi:polyisoprenoid-binding protein YceI
MKQTKSLFTKIFFLALFSFNGIAAEEKYTIEPNHTSVTWSANHFGFSKVSGKFNEIEGTILFDEKNPEKSSAEITIKTTGIVTGVAKLDEHLKSSDFFDVKNFPIAKFVSKKVSVTGKNKIKIVGDLTILNTTKTITLNAIFNKSGKNPINQKQTIGFSATSSLSRSEFGIKYALPAIDDKIDLAIEIEANR